MRSSLHPTLLKSLVVTGIILLGTALFVLHLRTGTNNGQSTSSAALHQSTHTSAHTPTVISKTATPAPAPTPPPAAANRDTNPTAAITPVTIATPTPAQQHGSVAVGFNWPAAGRVYVAHWNQQTVTSADPARVYRIAKADNIHLLRVFLGDDVIIGIWKNNPAAALNDIQRMFDDANANGIKLIVSDYLTKETIEALAGHSYPTWGDAQRDLITTSSQAYATFSSWKQAVLSRFGSHSAAYSWEVTNEPGWMLGIDSGAITRDQGYQFLDHFQALMHTSGAKLVNGGGNPLYDPSLLSNNQMQTYLAHLDILDNHIYPPEDGAGNPVGGAPEAQAQIDKMDNYFQRARQVSNRPTMPGMMGEFSTEPATWFQTLAQQSVSHGWTTLGWGFDSYDTNKFNDSVHPEILDFLKNLSPK